MNGAIRIGRFNTTTIILVVVYLWLQFGASVTTTQAGAADPDIFNFSEGFGNPANQGEECATVLNNYVPASSINSETLTVVGPGPIFDQYEPFDEGFFDSLCSFTAANQQLTIDFPQAGARDVVIAAGFYTNFDATVTPTGSEISVAFFGGANRDELIQENAVVLDAGRLSLDLVGTEADPVRRIVITLDNAAPPAGTLAGFDTLAGRLIPAPNADPVINDLDGDTITFTPPSASVPIDPAPGVSITDDQSDFDAGLLTFEYTSGYINGDTLSFTPGDGISNPSGTNEYQDNGITFATGSATVTPTSFIWELNLNAEANPDNVARLLRRFGFFTSNGTSGQRQITVTLDDGRGGSASAVVTVNVGPTNADPVINDLDGDNLFYVPGTGNAIIDVPPAVSVTDADSADFAGGQLRADITATRTTNDFIGILAGNGVTLSSPNPTNPTGAILVDGVVVGTPASSLGVYGVNFNAEATPERVGRVLGQVSFFSTGSPPATPYVVTVETSVTDGDGGTGTATHTITVGPPNQAPVINDLDGDSVTYTIGGDAVNMDANALATVTDADSADFDGGTLTVTGDSNEDFVAPINGPRIGSQFSAGGIGILVDGIEIGVRPSSGTGTGPGSFIINLSANATPDLLNVLLQNFGYRNTNATAAPGPRTIDFVLTDGDGGTSNTATVTVNVEEQVTGPTDITLPTAPDYECTGDGLQNAVNDLADGGTITIDCPGAIQLGSSILISGKVVNIAGVSVDLVTLASLDGGQALSANVIDAGGLDRHFVVDGGSSILNLIDITLTNGSAPGTETGGAIQVINGGEANLANVSIVNSEADGGAAISVDGTGGASEATLINSTIARNTTRNAQLGSLSVFSTGAQATLTLVNTTVTENAAAAFAGVLAQGNATLDLRNSILANNDGGDCLNALATVNFNTTNQINNIVLDDGFGGAQPCGNTTQYLDESPQFGAIQGLPPGVIQPHYRPASNSSAIDAGDDTLIPTGITEDQLGNPRIRGASVDMGAYESEDVCTTTFFQDPGAVGTTHTVPAGDTANFIQAVLCANQLIGSQQILLTEGSYSFTEDYPADGDIETALPTITDSLSIIGLDSGAIVERAASAAEDFRLFLFDMVDIGPDPIGSVENVTIRNGVASVGGAIAVQADGSVSATNAILEDNRSTGAGGAMHSTGPRINANGSTFSNNTAGTSGGAMFSPTGMTLGNSTFTGNSAQNGIGGAVVAQGEVRIVDTAMNNNSAPNGDGGAVHTSGNVLLAASTVSENSSGGQGGAIYTTGPLTVLNSIVNDNSGVDGGGLYSNSDDASRVFNSLFHDNTATNDGGALYINSSAAPVMRNNTFTQNIADSDNDSNGLGGGVFYDAGAVLSNSILWQNTLGNSNGTVDDFEGSLTFPTSIVSELGGADPNFTNPANDDFTLQATSTAAVDQGDNDLYNAVAPSEFEFFIDFDGDNILDDPIDSDVVGNPRFFNDGTIDLGAYEFQGSADPCVNYSFPYTVAAGDTADFIQAVACANANAPTVDVINLTDSTYTFTQDFAGDSDGETALPLIEDDLQINGNNAILDRDTSGPNLRFFYNNAVNLTLADMTMTNGASGYGGAMFLFGNTTIDNVTFTNNTAPGSGGGAIGQSGNGNMLIIRDSNFQNNSANTSGAIDISNGSAQISNTRFAGNQAIGTDANDHAGAIWVSTAGTTTIDNSLFVGNGSQAAGAAIFHSDGPLTITNTTFDNNDSNSTAGAIGTEADDPLTLIASTITASSTALDGAGIQNDGGTLIFINSTISGNNNFNGHGAAISASGSSSTTITNTTIAGNTSFGAADASGGLSVVDSTVTVNNSIISGNTAPAIGITECNIVNSTFNASNNLFGVEGDAGGCVPTGTDTGNVIANVPLASIMGGLADNGGPTQTRALTQTSPALNIGDNAFVTAADFGTGGDGVIDDQRGDGFPRIVGPAVDAGAFESEFIPAPAIELTKAIGTVTSDNSTTPPSFAVPVTLVVSNTGNIPLTDVQITDDIATQIAPANLLSVSSLDVTGDLTPADLDTNYDGETVTTLLQAGTSLDAGQSATITFTANIDPNGAGGTFTNAASADADSSAGAVSDATDPQQIDVPETLALTLDKTAADAIINPDGTADIAYSITLTNDSNVPVSNVQITDDLAAAFAGADSFSIISGPSVTGATGNAAFDGDTDTNLLDATSSTLDPSATATVEFTLRLTLSGDTSFSFTNAVDASANGVTGTQVTQAADAQSDITFTVSANVDKTITIVDNPDTLGLFDIDVTILVENDGDLNLNGLNLQDALDNTFGPDVTLVAVSTPAVTGDLVSDDLNSAYDGVDEIAIFDDAALDVGESAEITFSLTINPNGTPGPFTNTATLRGAAIPGVDLDETSDSAEINIPENLLLTVTKTQDAIADDEDDVLNNEDGTFDVTYTLTLTNGSNVPLNSVQVVDDLATSFGATTSAVMLNGTPTSSSPNLTLNAAYDGSSDTNLLDAANSTLDVGETATITLPVRLTLTFGDSLTHQNEVSADGLSPLGAEIANDDSLQTEIIVNPVIAVAKAAEVTPDGDSSFDITLTFTVENLGDIPLSGLQVTDNLVMLYNGTTLEPTDISSTGGDLTYNANFDGQTDTNLLDGSDTIAVGATRTLVILLDAVQPTTTGLFSNRADASAEGIVSIVTDISDDGTEPDANGDGNPDEAGENDRTPITLTTSTLSAQKAVDLLPQDDPNNNRIAEPGEILTYTVTIVNTNTVAAVNVRFMDPLDPNVTLLSLDGATNDAQDGTINASLGDLPVGEQVVLVYRVQVNERETWLPEDATQIRNQGAVMADNLPDAVLTDDPATPQIGDATVVPLADPQATLEATKADTLRRDADRSGDVTPGDTLTYTIEVRNIGGTTAENVLLTDLIEDPNLVLLDRRVVASTTRPDLPQPEVTVNATEVVVTLAQLPPGDTLTLTLDVVISDPLLDDGATRVSNQALVAADNAAEVATDDPDTAQPDDPTVTPLGEAVALLATKRVDLLDDVDASGGASPGDRLQYRISIENPGPSTALGVTLTDALDANLAIVPGSLTTTQGSINSGSGAGDATVDITLGDVPVGQAVVVSYLATIADPLNEAATQISNQAIVTVTNGTPLETDDPTQPGDADPTLLDLQADVQLRLEKTGVRTGMDITYTVTLFNDGEATATGLRFEDLATDPNLSLVPSSVQLPPGASIETDTADMLILTLADLAGGGQIDIVFDAVATMPPAGVPAEVANQARVTADNANPVLSDDPNTPAANDPTRLPLADGAVLELTKAATFTAPVEAGATIDYQLVLSNSGDATATNLIVTDPLADAALAGIAGTPTALSSGAGTPVVEAQPDGSLRVTLNQLEAGENLTIDVSVTLTDPLPDGATFVENQATVVGDNMADVVSDDPNTPADDDATRVPLGSFSTLDATLSDTVLPQVDAALSAPDDPIQARPGDRIRYTARLTNTDANPAQNVVYNDLLDDPLLTLVVGSVTTSQGTVTTGNADDDTTVAIEVGEIAPDAVVTITYEAQVAPAVPQGVTLVRAQGAITGANIPDGTTRDPAGFERTQTPLIVERFSNLTVQVSLPEQTAPGQRLLVRADVFNELEAVTATNTALTFTVPENTIFLAPVTGNCTQLDVTITCEPGEIGPGSAVSASFFLEVNADAPLDTRITVQALAASDQTPAPQPSNLAETIVVDAASLTTTDLALTLDDGRSALVSGNRPAGSTTTTYELTVFNTGLDVTDATLTATLPDVFDPASIAWACATTAPQTCPTIPDPGATTLDLSGFEVLNNADLLFTVTATLLDVNNITPVPPVPVEVLASVSSALDADGVTGNNSARDVNGVVYDPPRGVKTGTWDGGEIITWTQRWINSSALTATAIEIRDPLPSGQEVIPGTLVCDLNGATVGICDVSGNVVRFSGSIGPDGPGFETPDDSLRITFDVRISGGGDYTNESRLRTATGVPELTSATDTVSVPFPPTVGGGGGGGTPNLTLTKLAVPAFAQPGDAVTFTLTVNNVGDGVSSAFTLVDVVPPEFAVVSANVSGAGAVNVSGNTVTYESGGFSGAESATITIQTTVRDSVTVPFTLTNTATLGDLSASASVISVSELPATGETPWWRLPLLALLLLAGGLLTLGLGRVALRRER